MSNSDLQQLFLNNTPLMDVRAPVEYEQGSFPNSQNLPLLDNEQRHIIGTEYKRNGQDSAIQLGWELATDEIRQQRLSYWQKFIEQHPNGSLYCFRGGLRSQLSQKLLRQAGIDYPIVKGGYKAMRSYLLEQLDQAYDSSPVVVVAGPTGSGKTRAIWEIERGIDLEGRANHRGSAFGGLSTEQPSQIDFENQISIDWLKLRHQADQQAVFVEDEGRLIGRIGLPLKLQSTMKPAPTAVIEEPLQQRIEWILDDYVRQPLQQNPAAVEQFSETLVNNLFRIRKRLGGERHQKLLTLFKQAADDYKTTGQFDSFEQGIEILLTGYYDPMYQYQLQQREQQIVFRGSNAETVAWCNQYSINQ